MTLAGPAEVSPLVIRPQARGLPVAALSHYFNMPCAMLRKVVIAIALVMFEMNPPISGTTKYASLE